MTTTEKLEQQLAQANATIKILQQELIQTNQEVIALTLDLARRVDDRTTELRESERKYRLLADNTVDCIWQMDMDLVFTYVNPAVHRLTGFTPEEWHGSHLREHVDPSTYRQITSVIQEVVAKLPDDTPISLEAEIRRKHGPPVPVDVTARVLVDAQGTPTGVQGVARDITERREAERALHAYSEQLEEMVAARTEELERTQQRIAEALALNEKIIDASSVGIAVYEGAGTCLLANAALAEILGAPRDRLVGQNFRELAPWTASGLLGAAEEALQMGTAARREVQTTTTFGQEVQMECRLVPFALEGRPHLLLLADDITERREMQARMVRQERLATLGQLAGSVSHELRNPLGSVKNAAYFLNMVLEHPDREVREAIEIMVREIERADRTIVSLLDFARAKPPTRKPVELRAVLERVIPRLALPDGVTLDMALAASLPPLVADAGQMEEVFYNLMQNGLQAMPEEGRLTIAAQEVPGALQVTLIDTGMGIPPENLRRVFDPLFTTKATGIGLGLSIVKAFVEGHGGAILVESVVGEGTTFTMTLPIS